MSSKDDLVNAIQLIKSGQTEPAGKILHDLLIAEPENERAWLAMYYCVTTPADRRFCLEKVLAIDPANPSARKFLARLDQDAPKPGLDAAQPLNPSSAPTWNMKNLYIAVGISLSVILVIILILAVTSR